MKGARGALALLVPLVFAGAFGAIPAASAADAPARAARLCETAQENGPELRVSHLRCGKAREVYYGTVCPNRKPCKTIAGWSCRPDYVAKSLKIEAVACRDGDRKVAWPTGGTVGWRPPDLSR